MALFLSAFMAVVVPLQGCSAAWIATMDNILAASAPALIDILTIIYIAENKPIDATLVNKINADAANVKVLAEDFAAASAAAAPTACAQLQAGIQVYSADQMQVMALAQVIDPTSPAAIKITALSTAITGTIVLILALIPQCQQAATMKASFEGKAVPVPLKRFVADYNKILVVKTGSPAIDFYTARHKVHVHSKLRRVLELGFSY